MLRHPPLKLDSKMDDPIAPCYRPIACFHEILNLVTICFVSFRFVSFRFVSFRFVSFRFVSFRFSLT